jgi:hypothetical protein
MTDVGRDTLVIVCSDCCTVMVTGSTIMLKDI